MNDWLQKECLKIKEETRKNKYFRLNKYYVAAIILLLLFLFFPYPLKASNAKVYHKKSTKPIGRSIFGDTWECGQCGYENYVRFSNCSVCGYSQKDSVKRKKRR